MRARLFIAVFTVFLASCSFSIPQLTPTPSPFITAQPENTATATTVPEPVPTEISTSSGLLIEIYALSSPPSTDPLAFYPTLSTQAQILLKHQDQRDQEPSRRVFEANQALQPFGIYIRPNWSTDPTLNTTYTITKDSASLFKQEVFGFSPVSVNTKGTDFLMVVNAADGNYLMSTEGIEKAGMDLALQSPVYLRNEVLTASEVFTDTENGSSGEVDVKLGGQEIFKTSIGIPSPVNALRGLWSDGTNWILEVARAKGSADTFQVIGEIYQNGISLNQKYGYQSTFEYQLMADRPFYFFQKNDQIGISYDGQEFPLGFDDIPHYGCCSGGELNPRKYSSMLDFFARKNSDWYFVEISKQ